jgi:hypothetical protein
MTRDAMSQAPGRTALHIGERLATERTSWAHNVWHDHGLSIVLVVLFVFSMAGQVWAGWLDYNCDQRQHGDSEASLQEYLSTGHFGEATFENWESEFLQMAFFVVLTTFLYQKGSSESKRPDVAEMVDLDPRESPDKARAPWPVRKGGFVLTLYENSLGLTFTLLFIVSVALHAVTGAQDFSDEQIAHGQRAVSIVQYLVAPRFWFESFQNWQSEFLSLAAMVTFTIFLRQRGSPESKPVDAPMWETGR